MNAMTLERRFSIERVALLLKNRILEEAPVLGIGAAIVLGLNAIDLPISHSAMFNHMDGWKVNGNSVQGSAWSIPIFIAGIILASLAFKGLHGRQGADGILLPATSLEKYAAAFLDYVVAFPIAAAAAGTALSALLYVVERALGWDGGKIWTFWSPDALKSWATYAAMAVVFLAGSATFRKAAWLKTFGLACAYCLLVSFASILMIDSLGVHGLGFTYKTEFMMLTFTSDNVGLGEAAAKAVRVGSDILFKAVVPAFAILFGAAKVAEKEGRDEIQ